MSMVDVSGAGYGTPAGSSPRAARRPLAGRWRLRHLRRLAFLPAIALCFAAWAALAPPQLGGSTSYSITAGTSMLPGFHAGDLVLLRRQPTYHVGEVAGYHNGQLGVTVMHRIVAVNGVHFVFKGDNNSWTDQYQPVAAQIVGAEWQRLPGGGKLMLTLRTPAVTAAVLGLLGLVIFWPRPSSSRPRKGPTDPPGGEESGPGRQA
jgi:signal peptidase I